MSAKRKHRNSNEYLKYLKGELSNEERYSFERDLQADPFALEAMEGMDQVSADEFEEDILSLHSALRKRLQRRRRRTFYYAAASIASLLIVGTIFLNIYNINPKTAEETIPTDETFLHEDLAEPTGEALSDEVSKQVEAPVREERPKVQSDTPAPEETRAQVQDPDELVIQEDKALQAAEEMPDEALVTEEAEAPVPAAVAPVKEAAAPVQKADELVVMEAQPNRAQKKGRAKFI